MTGTPGLSSYPRAPQNADISCANSEDISCVNDRFEIKNAETSLQFSRLLQLGEFAVALGGQIRFNAWAQLEGENNEKTICISCGGRSDFGSDGGAGLCADGQGSAAQSGGEGQLHAGRREDDYRGLLEPARQGAQDLWRIGPLWRSVARRSQRGDHFRYHH